MIANPDHAVIKALAVNMLGNMKNTPEEKQRLCPELMPNAEYHNGLMRPNGLPPESVRIELCGDLWIYSKDKKRWRKN